MTLFMQRLVTAAGFLGEWLFPLNLGFREITKDEHIIRIMRVLALVRIAKMHMAAAHDRGEIDSLASAIEEDCVLDSSTMLISINLKSRGMSVSA